MWFLHLSFPSTRGIPSITSWECELRNLPCGLVLNFIIFRVKVCLKFTFYTDTSRSSKGIGILAVVFSRLLVLGQITQSF